MDSGSTLVHALDAQRTPIGSVNHFDGGRHRPGTKRRVWAVDTVRRRVLSTGLSGILAGRDLASGCQLAISVNKSTVAGQLHGGLGRNVILQLVPPARALRGYSPSGRFAEGQGFGDPSIPCRKRLEPGGEFEPRPREIKSLIEQSCMCTVGLQRSVSSSSRNPAGRCRLILARGWRKPASNRTGPASSRLSLAG
jgi:hypothetical protein